MTAGDGNIPASNTSALLYARTRASTETIHPPPPADTQRRMSTPVSVRGSASRRPATGDQRGGTYIRRTGVETEREGERGRDPVSPGHTDTRGHVRMWVPYIYNLSTYWALRFGGPPRLDLRLFNSSACQKHQCTLCSPIVLPFFLPPTPLSPLPFFLPLSASPSWPTPFARSLSLFSSFPWPPRQPLPPDAPSSFLLSLLCTHAAPHPPLVYRTPPPGWRND